MRPKAYPACVLLSVAVAASFLGIGRVALRSLHSAKMAPPSIEALDGRI